VSSAPSYEALTVEQRLEVERQLYRRIFDKPYTERSIPPDASPRQKEYLISCIRSAIQTHNDGTVIPPHQVDATRELTARNLSAGVETPREFSAEAQQHMYRLCTEGRLPHRLEDYFVEAEVNVGQDPWQKHQVLADQVLVPDGVHIEGLLIDPEGQRALLEPFKSIPAPGYPARVQGVNCRVILMARETGIPRRQIAEKCLKRLGYRRRGERGSQGYVAFEKERPDGGRLSCDFDFGTWRASVIALFAYSNSGVKVRFPLQYWRESEPVGIITRKQFTRTMENVAYVLEELEAFLAGRSESGQ
jgi:hypothetical protein